MSTTRAILLAACAASLIGADAPADDFLYADEHYASGDASVEIECFAPATPGRHPAVLLLHGSGGLAQATHEVFRGMARDMVACDYVVFIPHYFDATGHEPGRPIRQDEQLPFNRAVEDAIKFAAGRDEVDAENLGLFGMSMGAGLAFSQGARDKRVKAVVSLSGSLPIGSRSKYPPTLLLHGSKDASTPVKYLRMFEEQLEAKETPVEVKVYAGAGHNFEASRFPELSRRSTHFLDRYLKPIDPARGKPSGSKKKKKA